MVNMNLADKELFLRNTREIDRYIYIERERGKHIDFYSDSNNFLLHSLIFVQVFTITLDLLTNKTFLIT
jgi:hypothetical protein